MNRGFLILLLVLPAALGAHVISVSTGELTVRGARADYLLKIPLTEVDSVKDPENALLGRLQFTSAGVPARVANRTCIPAGPNLVCAAEYVFLKPVSSLRIDCRLYEVAAPTHIHLLHARKDGLEENVVLDYALPSATLHFQPTSPARQWANHFLEGAMRALTSPVQWLITVCLAIAARNRRELVAISLAFLLAQTTASCALLWSRWPAPARLTEAATALALAYLAVEVLWIPAGRGRWIPAAFLGLLHAAFFVTPGTASPIPATIAEALVFILLIGIASWFPRSAVFQRSGARLQLIASAAWFVLRLRG